LGALDGVCAALDVACGYGVIGLALALRAPEAEICMTDDNLLAVCCAERGAHLNGVAERCRILAGDALEPVAGRRFDLIACNPPFHQGRDVEFSVARRIMRQAAAHLSDGGRFVLVANLFLRYEDDLIAHWGRVRTLAANDRFHVLEARDPR
jgi:16S rRNA (guanine1207-N2)-methyltransferase